MKKRVKAICKVDLCAATVTIVTLKQYLNKGYRIHGIKKVSIAAS